MLAFWSVSDRENSSKPTLEKGHRISPWSCHKKYRKPGDSETWTVALDDRSRRSRCGQTWPPLGVWGLSHAPPAAAAGGCQALASAWFPSTSAAISHVFLPNVARSVFKFLSDKDKGHWTPVHWIQQALILKVTASEELLFPSSVTFKSTRD